MAAVSGASCYCPFGSNVVGSQAVVSIVLSARDGYRKGHMPAGRRFASVVAAASAAVVPVVLTGTAGAVAAVHALGAGGTSGAGTWGVALTPPGLSALEQGVGPASSAVSVVSCASANNCSAAGVLPQSRQPGRRKPRGIRRQRRARHLAQRNQDRRHHSQPTRRGHSAADVCVVRGGGRVQRRGRL